LNCGLRIANCGFRMGEVEFGLHQAFPKGANSQSAIRNPQSAIRNPQSEKLT